jgi:uncharacterized protein
MNTINFDKAHLLHNLKHFLPSQTPLKDFIHHNSLHAFQNQKFFDAIFSASKIFGIKATFHINEYRKLYTTGRIREDIMTTVIKSKKLDVDIWKQKMLTGKYNSDASSRVGTTRDKWKDRLEFDLNDKVQPKLFRIICSYLDQGISLWHFPKENLGLIAAIRYLENNSYTSFFQSKLVKNIIKNSSLCNVEYLLKCVVGNDAQYHNYLFDQQFSHKGWSGIVSAIESAPDTLLYPKAISLEDLIILELLLELDALEIGLGKGFAPLYDQNENVANNYFLSEAKSETEEVLEMWQLAFEWTYFDDILSALKQNITSNGVSTTSDRSFQAIFCIDERECSLRRHIENVDTQSETLGCPGFFGVEFYFQPHNGKFYEKLCPAPVTPKYLIKETGVTDDRKHELMYTKNTHTFFRGFLTALSLGFMAAYKLVDNIFNPTMSPAISDAFAHMNISGVLTIENKDIRDRENNLQIGFTIEEMATRVENLLRGIGFNNNFADIVYIVGHGSSSANNPHHGAHDCGACSGRPGSVNARVFAFMANHEGVRKILTTKGFYIPTTTIFVGALHDTASDEMAFYDEMIIPNLLRPKHDFNKSSFEKALDQNAKERSRRFASIDTNKDIKHVRNEIRKRSVSLFEPRPELGHGTNALCFVGSRALTKGMFLDRRAFMNSYDYRTDPDGALLINVIRPLPIVCGGINLEYYFSRMDNYKMGAGTKLPHNVMGLIGVANSSDGDLRSGLPLQMIEVHDPVRLMILVEQRPQIVLNTIKSDSNLYEWFENEWVHITAIDPDSNEFFYFKNGVFENYIPTDQNIRYTNDINQIIESSKEMETNFIVDATKENLPVYVIKNEEI